MNSHPTPFDGSGRSNQPPAGVFIGRAHLDRNMVRPGEIDGPTAILPNPATLNLPGMNAGRGHRSARFTDDTNVHPFARAEAWVPQPRTTWVMPS
jgi:hypothetical protein